MTWRRIDVHRAVERGDLVVLERYLEAGGDVEKKDEEYGAAPIHWAALRGRLKVLPLLVGRGGNLESRTKTDGTPLVWGCMGGDEPVVRYLLEHGANISATTKGKGTALHHAAHSGFPEVVALLLEKGADPMFRDIRGEKAGDTFDSEVSESNRRAIAEALKAARDSSLVEKDSSGKSNRCSHSSGAQGEGLPASGDEPCDDNMRRITVDAGVKVMPVLGQVCSAPGGTSPTRESEGIFSTAKAIAATAWTPLSPSKKTRSVVTDTTGSGAARRGLIVSNGVDNHAAVGIISSGRSRGRSRSSSRSGSRGKPHRYAVPNRHVAAAAVAGEREGHPSMSPPPSHGFNGAAVRQQGSIQGLDDLRRRVRDAKLAAASAESRESQGRVSARRALKEADERALAAVAAARVRSETLDALVQALEQRLRDKDEEVAVLAAELDERDARLQRRDRQVVDLQERMEKLVRSRDTPVSPAAAAEMEALSPTTYRLVDRTCGDESTALRPFQAAESGAAAAALAAVGEARLRTHSSPALSPTPEAAASVLLLSAGVTLSNKLSSGGTASAPGSGERVASRGASGAGGGVGDDRRSTIGPGTAVTAVAADKDELFSHALESLAARADEAVRGGRATAFQAGLQGSKKRLDWEDEVSGEAKKNPLPPPPRVEEVREHLGSLYSMIARR